MKMRYIRRFVALLIVLCLILMSILSCWLSLSSETMKMIKSNTGDMLARDAAAESHETGYVLVNHYSDQMTGASHNILSLQCWAASVSSRLKVVEPFVHFRSGFGVTLTKQDKKGHRKIQGGENEEVNTLRLRDVLDIKNWEEQLKGTGHAPLESWTTFLSQAPRNLIIVVSKPCSSVSGSCSTNFQSYAESFAVQNNFSVVRYARIENKTYSYKEFQDLVYGKINPSQSVVLFSHWGGLVANKKLFVDYRIRISDVKRACNRDSFFDFLFKNSAGIVKDSNKYQERYISDAKTRGYISVMLRTEKLHLNADQFNQRMLNCMTGILKRVRSMKAQYNITSVFFSLDCRKQGSRVFQDSSSNYFLNKEIIDLITEMLYMEIQDRKTAKSLEDWDTSFEEVASFQIPGYVALLQKNLAASGSCLVTAGGGSFQQSAIQLYKSVHQNSRWCYEQVPECN